MTLYLPDSDLIIDFVRRRPRAEAFIEMLFANEGELCTCAVVLSEVYTGFSPDQAQVLRRFLENLRFLPTSGLTARLAGVWRYQFARRGIILHRPDVLIAATALEHDAVLVTRNVRDFPMGGLEIMAYPLS